MFCVLVAEDYRCVMGDQHLPGSKLPDVRCKQDTPCLNKPADALTYLIYGEENDGKSAY